MTFDHHEDVTLLDSEENPSAIHGFQIKTSGTNWTIPKLLKREAGESKPPSLLPSILGKLYDLKIKFPKELNGITFVSNTSVSVHLKADGKKNTSQKQTKFEILSDADQKLICDSLKTEATLSIPPALAGLLEFLRSEIPVDAHATHGRGKLVEFLNALYPQKQFQVNTLFITLLSEVAARNNNQDPIVSFEDFLKRKSLSRSRFDEILSQAGVTEKAVDWPEVAQRLNSEQAPFAYTQSIKAQWDQVTIDRLARRDVPFLKFWEQIETACTDHIAADSLWKFTEAATADALKLIRKESGFSANYVRACVLVKIYELKQSENLNSGTEGEESA